MVNLVNEYLKEYNAESSPFNQRPPLKIHEVELIITRDPDQAMAKDAHACVGIRPASHISIEDSILFELKTEGKISEESYRNMTSDKG